MIRIDSLRVISAKHGFSYTIDCLNIYQKTLIETDFIVQAYFCNAR